ncbi:hypothetical protein [Arthrobacter sp. A2-55]|uniref:hypothetical protein n=1 Tax=Arthrobacter sp. A2-55 TaxID=2897337 RepID=UPI0021CDD398|nr:hypothetical protein [Arthrobacter sp. A2-55]MCU6480137.1 hypothetical protein [Arthrobacter sp. A2-55]
MARKLTTTQRQLATDVLELSTLRAALVKQLAEIELFQQQAIAHAEQNGVRQRLLSVLADLSPGRISQVVKTADPSSKPLQAQRREWRRAIDSPQERLVAFTMPATEGDRLASLARIEALNDTNPGPLNG